MTYNSIPIPTFPFAEISERKANDFFKGYFQGPYLMLNMDVVLRDVEGLILQQRSKQDRVVILSFLINRLSEKTLKLTEETAIHEFQEILFFLYRLIEEDGIEIPTDLFSKDDYTKAEQFLLQIHTSIEQLKVDDSENSFILTGLQEKIKGNSKFWGLGKEKWIELVVGGIIKYAMEKGVLPLIIKVLLLAELAFKALL